jgi:hypothetical protein
MSLSIQTPSSELYKQLDGVFIYLCEVYKIVRCSDCRASQCRIVRQLFNRQGCDRKSSCHNLRLLTRVCVKGLRIKIVRDFGGVRVEIRIGCHKNICMRHENII